jgi:hypothetical protein
VAISGVGQQKSFADLQTEFGGSHPITMGEYASFRVSGSGNTIDMDDFAGATANAFPGSGEDSWFQTSGIAQDAPPNQWGYPTVSNASYAQAGCNVGFQNDQTNDRIAMRWTTFTSAAASSYSYAYVGYDGFATNTFYAKCVYVTSSSGFVGTVENPASYSPATNTYTPISTSTYSPVWQWSATVSSGSGTRSITSSTHPDWTVASNSSGANAISGPARALSVSATRGTAGPGGGGGFFCIHEDMLVSTANGNMKIDDIIATAPPKIWGYNKEHHRKELGDVLEIKVVDHDNLYKINDIILTEDHAIYDENYRLLSVNPTKTRENYKKDATKIKVGDKIRKEDESLETVTSIEAYSGTHRTYTIKTSFDNFYADSYLVDSEI